MQPEKLLLRTAGACDIDPEHLLDVFGEQRRRFVTVLQGFSPDDWAAPTRCAHWSAHDVVRHLRDDNAIMAGASADDRTLDLTAGYDPRVTPRTRLAESAAESPACTLSRLVASSEENDVLARDWLARNRGFDIRLPFGAMDWTVLVLHGFWDSWIHERDVLLAQNIEHPTDDDATFYATAYGVFLAGVAAWMFGSPVHEVLKLSGNGGGVFDLDARGGVTLTVHRGTTEGPPAAQVADALAGRAPIAAVLSDLLVSSRAALSCLGDYFNAPAEPAGPTPRTR